MKDTLTQSIYKTSTSDEMIEYRFKLLEYLDNHYYSNNEYLFFNFLEYMRYIMEKDAIAYTTKDRYIYMNAPHKSVKNDEEWDFIFAHECLHQIYDTFAVGDLIKKELGESEYDHYLLNIASDCVINETLKKKYRKRMPEIGISAKYIKSEYGVSYDFNTDTQFSLYLKLLEFKKNNKEKYEEMKNDQNIKNATDIHDKSGQNGQSHGSGDNLPGQSGSGETEPGQKGGKYQSNDQTNDGSGSGNTQQGQQGQSSSTPGNGDENNVNGDGQETSGNAKPGDGGTQSSNDRSYGEREIDPMGNGKFAGYKELADYYDSEPDQPLDDLIKKAKNTMTGPLGEFIEKIKKIPAQVKSKKFGIDIFATKGSHTNYNDLMFKNIKNILSNRIQSLQKKYKDTYSRVNRRTPHAEGGIIRKGRKLNMDKVTLTITFYVDISGSMTSETVKKIFENLYNNASPIIETYKKTFGHIIENIDFKYYSFNEKISPVLNKTIPYSSGGNVELSEIIKYIHKYTETSLINVIITDAGFEINNANIIKEFKDNDGYLIILTDNLARSWEGSKTIQQESNGKIISITTETF